MRKHLRILEYALSSLARRKYRNMALGAAFTFTVAVLASVLFLTGALKHEASALLQWAPDLIVQRTLAGRHELVPVDYVEKIREIPGVGVVRPRYWGYYYDALTGANYTVLGVGGEGKDLELLEGRLPSGRGECAVGAGVSAARLVDTSGDLILVDSSNTGAVFQVVGVFRSESGMLTNDLVVLTTEDVVRFFGFPGAMATDISVQVHNENELQTVAGKVKRLMPETRPITRSELLRTYDMVFSWRSGMMLTVFAAALIAFCILAWDKATGLSAEERREIGILKAIGWDTSDILELKFWEGFAISCASFLMGTILGFIHVFLLGAPLLAAVVKGWSVLFPEFRLSFHVNLYQVFVLGFLTVVPYVMSTVVPSWKAAVADPEGVMRG